MRCVALGLFAIALGVSSTVAAEPAPWLGIGYGNDGGGATVTEVYPGSGAASAGLRRDDVIVAIGGEPVMGDDLSKLIGRYRIGDRAPMLVYRGGRRLVVAARLQARPSPDELLHQRLVGYDLPDLAVERSGELTVDAWHGRPMAVVLMDAHCEACEDAITALADRFARGPLAEVPVEAWVLGQADELQAYLDRVPLPVAARRVDRERGRALLGGINPMREGAIVVVDAAGTIRYAASTGADQLADEGAARVAARLVADWRASR